MKQLTIPKITGRESIILDLIADHPADLVSVAADNLQISRATILRDITSLIEKNFIEAEGSTHKTYTYGQNRCKKISVPVAENREEYLIWKKYFDPVFKNILPKNIDSIVFYGFTEMVNNIIDHANAATMELSATLIDGEFTLYVGDDGEGIFKKITREYNLPDERLALLELAKGKLTTDKKNHTGQGIFFTSRMFDTFSILSGNLVFLHDNNDIFDYFPEQEDHASKGTVIVMSINMASTRTSLEVFNKFSTLDGDLNPFDKTIVPLKLARLGSENLISRSQAKRVYARFESFRLVYLDFGSIEEIGQAFADELFRVFHTAHPEVTLLPMNTTQEIKNMIIRANPAFKSYFILDKDNI